MSDPRILGLTLMAIATAAFLGSTHEQLPPETFFLAMALFGIGAFKFLRTNHEAMAKAEMRAKRAVNPKIHENRRARAHADLQATNQVVRASSNTAVEPLSSTPPEVASDWNTVDLESDAEDFVVTTDVSLPVEVQTGDALADQLQKL